MPTIAPVLQSNQSRPNPVSSLELMKLIFKINSVIDKTSFEALAQKKRHLSIFQLESSKHQNLKSTEGTSLFSLAMLSAVAQISSHMSSDMTQQAFKILASVSPIFSQTMTSVFQAYEINHQAKKQIANIELDANREVQNKADQQVQKNLDSLQTVVKNMDSLNHLR